MTPPLKHDEIYSHMPKPTLGPDNGKFEENVCDLAHPVLHVTYADNQGLILLNGRQVFWQGPGAGQFRNNPDSQCVVDLGQIPCGFYSISPAKDICDLHSAIRLSPDSSSQMCGRHGFHIHGDYAAHPGWASASCMMLADSTARRRLSESFSTLEEY